MLLPFANRLLKYFPDMFNFEKIGKVASNIIAERTKLNGHSKNHVSVFSQSPLTKERFPLNVVCSIVLVTDSWPPVPAKC